MINGKFFTGLTPKMMDRGVGAGKNHLESHLFWPDDTKAVSATDSRLTRRTGLQQGEPEKPTATGPEKQADTKKMFHREFAKSSIQFYDNLEEQPAPSRLTPRSQQIALKPNATRLELPESVVDQTYRNAKKQQVFTSKIEFDGFPNEGLDDASRNGVRTPRVDINDKKEFERNTKNSPKLQNKSTLKAVPDVQTDSKLRKDYGGNKGVEGERNTRRSGREPEWRPEESLQMINDEFRTDYMMGDSPKTRTDNVGRRINNSQSSYNNRVVPGSDNDYYGVEPDVQFIENNMRNLRIPPRARKHVTHRSEFEDYGGYAGMNNEKYRDESTSPNQSPGSKYRRPPQRHLASRYDARRNADDYHCKETRQTPPTPAYNNHMDAAYETDVGNSSSRNSTNFNNSNMKSAQAIMPKMSTTSAAPQKSRTSDFSTTESAPRKQLFNLFAPSTATPTATRGDVTPTPSYRRARNSAVQRVSVGLPD